MSPKQPLPERKESWARVMEGANINPYGFHTNENGEDEPEKTTQSVTKSHLTPVKKWGRGP